MALTRLGPNQLINLATNTTGSLNLTSQVTGTLPASNGGTGTTSYSPGITEYDEWRLTTAFQGAANPISSNLERNDQSFEKIGTGMTESSGVFTFPSTGKWLIQVKAWRWINNAAERAAGFNTEYSSDSGSTWTSFISMSDSLYNSGDNTNSGTYGMGTLDVTNASTWRIRMTASSVNASTYTGANTARNLTSISFLKLGDT